MSKDVHSSEVAFEEILLVSIPEVNLTEIQTTHNNENTAPLDINIPGCPNGVLLF